MTPSLRALRPCFEGAVPASIATCAADGTPNVTKLSHVHFVDDRHVALSYQFFNKTRRNVLATGRATVEVLDPVSAAHYHLHLEYLRTETEGPLFETMKARLAAIASHTGMRKVFRLLGADLYRVLRIETVGDVPPVPGASPTDLLAGLRAFSAELLACAELAPLLDTALQGLEHHWDIHQAIVALFDRSRGCLYTVASRGYPESGIGSEVRIGEGILGIAALERTPIRIEYAVQEYRYCLAARQRFAESAQRSGLETEIPLPGLPEAGSQMAVPLLAAGRLLGVLYVESPLEQRFTYRDEDALVVLAGQLALAIELLAQRSDQPAEGVSSAAAPPAAGPPVLVRHFPADHSVFVVDDYLIKGVAGAILRRLLAERERTGRVDFTTRELRLDASLGLPDVTDNLDARLILLQRRLAERCPAIALEKTGRGRWRLALDRPVRLVDMPP
jgi:adenylate cyclase